MSTENDLAKYLRYAAAVREALPVDEDAERQIAALLNRRPEGYQTRKLSPKGKARQ